MIEEIKWNKVDIVKQTDLVEPQIGLPQIYRYITVLNNPVNNITGSGFSINEDQSKIASLGEAVERYSASIINSPLKKDHEINNLKRLNLRTVTRTDTNNDFNKDRKWVETVDYITKQSKWMPSEMVYLNKTRYQPIRDIISTGLSANTNIKDAIIGGLCECVERDAFILFWLLGNINFKIDITKSIEMEFKILLNKAKSADLTIDLYDISTDLGIPVILTVVRRNNVKGFYLGCAANFDYKRAIVKSIEEGLGGYSVYTEATLIHGYQAPKDSSEIKSLIDRPLYYLSGKKDRILNQMIKDASLEKENMYVNKIPIKLEDAIGVLRKKNINVYYKDITTCDVKSIGFTVCRVVLPELNFLPTGKPMLHSVRLNNYVKKTKRKFNLEPHPFP